MSDTESKTPGLIGEAEIARMKRILDAKLETDEDYARLADLVEGEGYEDILVVDHDFDSGDGN